MVLKYSGLSATRIQGEKHLKNYLLMWQVFGRQTAGDGYTSQRPRDVATCEPRPSHRTQRWSQADPLPNAQHPPSPPHHLPIGQRGLLEESSDLGAFLKNISIFRFLLYYATSNWLALKADDSTIQYKFFNNKGIPLCQQKDLTTNVFLQRMISIQHFYTEMAQVLLNNYY